MEGLIFGILWISELGVIPQVRELPCKPKYSNNDGSILVNLFCPILS